VGGEWLRDPVVLFDWGEVTMAGQGESERSSYAPLSTPVSYVFLVSTTAGFEDTVMLDTLEVDSTSMILEEGVYHWQVYAYDGAGNVSLMSSESFGVDVQGPEAPDLLSPSNYDTTSLAVSETVTFVWNTVNDPVSGVDSYELSYMDTTVQIHAPETSYVLMPHPWTEFAWKVRAYDVAGNPGPWSEEWHLFLTEIAEGSSNPGGPTHLGFSRCWPSPTRGGITIEYTVPRETQVQVKVFDLSGRLLDVLADDGLSGSDHKVVWNGTDAVGTLVPAGIYYIALEAEETLVTWKVVRLE
jgi:hypothetical protein